MRTEQEGSCHPGAYGLGALSPGLVPYPSGHDLGCLDSAVSGISSPSVAVLLEKVPNQRGESLKCVPVCLGQWSCSKETGMDSGQFGEEKGAHDPSPNYYHACLSTQWWPSPESPYPQPSGPQVKEPRNPGKSISMLYLCIRALLETKRPLMVNPIIILSSLLTEIQFCFVFKSLLPAFLAIEDCNDPHSQPMRSQENSLGTERIVGLTMQTPQKVTKWPLAETESKLIMSLRCICLSLSQHPRCEYYLLSPDVNIHFPHQNRNFKPVALDVFSNTRIAFEFLS
ncbi:hypothetical protein H8959_008101 [Pygathrix nigripes]